MKPLSAGITQNSSYECKSRNRISDEWFVSRLCLMVFVIFFGHEQEQSVIGRKNLLFLRWEQEPYTT